MCVFARALDRGGHERDRLVGLGRIVGPLLRDPGADQHGSTSVQHDAYFRWKFGARFSAKAFGPSFESDDAITDMPIGCSKANASSSLMCSVARNVLRIASTASGPLPATVAATSRALSSALPSGTR